MKPQEQALSWTWHGCHRSETFHMYRYLSAEAVVEKNVKASVPKYIYTYITDSSSSLHGTFEDLGAAQLEPAWVSSLLVVLAKTIPFDNVFIAQYTIIASSRSLKSIACIWLGSLANLSSQQDEEHPDTNEQAERAIECFITLKLIVWSDKWKTAFSPVRWATLVSERKARLKDAVSISHYVQRCLWRKMSQLNCHKGYFRESHCR